MLPRLAERKNLRFRRFKEDDEDDDDDNDSVDENANCKEEGKATTGAEPDDGLSRFAGMTIT